jgi:transcriptional regulator with XRE-family HTH domain
MVDRRADSVVGRDLEVQSAAVGVSVGVTVEVAFGTVVRDRRRAEKLSQGDLAEKVEISRNYLSQIERGEATNLSWQVRSRLCDVLGIQELANREGGNLPESLQIFATRSKLPPDDVQMLANLKYRGKQPDTPEKWEMLYNVIKVAVGK